MGQMFLQRHTTWNFTASSLAQLCHHLLFSSQIFPCEAQNHLGCIDKILNDINMCTHVCARETFYMHTLAYIFTVRFLKCLRTSNNFT